MPGLISCEADVRLTGLKLELGVKTEDDPDDGVVGATHASPLHGNDNFVRIEALPVSIPVHLETIHLEMTCADRRRVRRRIIAPDGLEFGLALPTGTVLEPGTLLHANETRAYVVSAALEEVVLIQTRDWAEGARIAHQIGNLHRDIQTLEHFEMLALWDAPLELLLLRLGANFERTRRPFLGRPSWEH
jgi:urease accessory protein